jgi:hypothetical protein
MSYNRTYQISGEAGLNTTITPQADLISDIRSIEGITIVTFTPKNEEESAASNPNHVGVLSIKFDTFPFTEFDKDTQINSLIEKIRKIPAVNFFRAGQVNVLETRLKSLVKEMLLEKKTKRDRCLRIADRKYKKPSAYKSAAAERCRKGNIWKGIKEGSDEEAWELVGQKDLNISKVINDAGFKNDEESVNRLIPIIDNTPETTISPSQISNLKNFNNKPGEESLIKDMISVSKSPDSRQEYADYMKKRDEKENRNRGYNPVQNYDNVVKGNYEPPVLININGTLYVIGGRTRLYAGLAANKSMKVKILNTSQLKEILKEDESLYKWLRRQGTPGKTGGWIDCNAPIRKDGEIVGYKPCGRQKGEERAKYPSCRATATRCKDPGKGKTWGKTK